MNGYKFVKLVDEANDFLSSFGHADNTVFILELLFYIYICDQAVAAAIKHTSGYEQNENNLKQKSATFSIDEASVPENVLTNTDVDLVSSLNTALSMIETMNKVRLVDFFETVRARNTMYSSTTTSWAAILRKLLKILLRVRFKQQADVLEVQQGFDQIMDRLAFNRKTYFSSHSTPRQIITLMVRLLSPKHGETIYDPACGTGSLLIAATTAAKNTAAFGQDINVDAYSLARINFIINGSCDSQVALGDTLRHPHFVCGLQLKQFDVVVCEPPFSLHNWGASDLKQDTYNRFDYGLPPARNGDWAFISHVIKSMKAHGRAAVIVPTGALLRSGDERLIRKSVIEKGIVDAIVGLPTKLFPSSTTSFAIILLKKPDDNTPVIQDILFIDARSEYDPTIARNTFSFEERIVQAYRSRDTDAASARVVPLDEIRSNKYSLDISKYFRIYDDPINVSKVENKVAQVEKKLFSVNQKLLKYHDLI